MKKIIIGCLIFILFFGAGSVLFGLEIKEGRMKLVLHENMGKFSAYYLTDIGKNKYVSLFLDQDPRTSTLSISVDNKVYRMGESSAFRQTIETSGEGAKFIWRSSFLKVTQEFSFISSFSSPVSDGFLITVTVENSSEKKSTVGIRYVFDTYLGEDSGVHFSTDTVGKITGETEFFKYNIPEHIVSPAENSNFSGFQIMTDAAGITVPDKIAIANWKRLNETTWDYEVRSSRNFNHLPYSINDSGISIYYDQETLTSGSSRNIVLAAGAYTESGFTGDLNGTKSEIAEVFNKAVISGNNFSQDRGLSIQTDMLTINELLSKINEKIETGEEVTASELELMEQVISELKKRKNKYQQN